MRNRIGKLTVLHVNPLDLTVVVSNISLTNIDVFKLVVDIRGPSDVVIRDDDILVFGLAIFLSSEKLEGVVEETLGHQTTRDGWAVWIQFFWTLLDGVLLVVPQVLHLNDGIAAAQLLNSLILAVKLLVVTGLNISSMVLVEVVELVVNVNWCLDSVINCS